MFQYLLLALLAIARCDDDFPEKCDRYVDTAIVGAGPSGAYSAYRMKDTDEKVELVEYTDHIGGRLKSFRFPGMDDVTVEFGTSEYSDEHNITTRLIQDLKLTPMDQTIPWRTAGDSYFYMKGKLIKESDIWAGTADLSSYTMTNDEKKNIARIGQYYLEKLTGYTGNTLPEEKRLHLRVIVPGPDGKVNVHLYKYNITQALSLVASPGGQQFFMDFVKQKTVFYKDANALMVFSNFFSYQSQKITLKKIKEGMQTLPQMMVDTFKNTKSDKHTVTLNRKLDSIMKINRWTFLLKLKVTKTDNGRTFDLGPEENLCASKVILALPAESLKVIQYWPLKSGLVADALNSVRTVPISKVAMVFDSQYWDDKKTVFSDETISKISELGQSSGKYLLLASFAEADRVGLLQDLNMKPPNTNTNTNITADLIVSDTLNTHIISKLSTIFGKTFPKPLDQVGYFWTRYPQSGGESIWRAGNHYDHVRCVVMRPALMDDVFIVGSDFAWGNHQSWMEGSFETVDDVMSRFILDQVN